MKPDTIRELEKPLNSQHIAHREQSGKTLSYIEGWWAIAEANRIFGFDAWNRETVSLAETSRELLKIKGYGGKPDYDQWRVSYLAKVRITVGEIVREGTGYGSGMAKPEALGDAIESAAKEAETDAMKRALMTFGNPFGLALYDKTQANVVVDAQSPVLEALLTNMPTSSHADAVEWKRAQDEQIKGLSDAEFNTFKAAWAENLKLFASEKKAA